MVRLRDEDGQALLLALAFLLFFGLVIAAILTFAEASERATEGLREQRNMVYAADGAMDGAIQYARTPAGVAAGVGAFGAVPCITDSAHLKGYSADLNGVKATVTCVSVASPNNLYRRVHFTASVDGTPRVAADVLFHDGSVSPVPIDVLSWTYLR